KYFSDIRKELLDDFTITTPLSIDDQKVFDDITNETSVSLHVRRGDYVTNKSAAKFHGLKGIDYYKKGLELIGSHTPSFKLFVFSDDIEWCKSQLSDIWDNIVFVDGKREGYMDMHLMKHCSHNIVANSSFSWWAAWLNQNESKVIVAPKNWFNDAKTNTKDVVPKAWHRI
ncbi:alpha-1,2-fucosyltransferase, partial [Candidatus Saccharibacteria bacterium]|nr:alpha-1,2-fucosyltransferase [Candidatus Saccharibacteria bacterium]